MDRITDRVPDVSLADAALEEGNLIYFPPSLFGWHIYPGSDEAL
jgi:hypothetical protein